MLPPTVHEVAENSWPPAGSDDPSTFLNSQRIDIQSLQDRREVEAPEVQAERLKFFRHERNQCVDDVARAHRHGPSSWATAFADR